MNAATDINGNVTLSGTGSGSGTASWLATDTNTYTSAFPPEEFSGDSQAKYSYTGGWSQNYASGTVTPNGTNTQTGSDTATGISSSYSDQTSLPGFAAGDPSNVPVLAGDARASVPANTFGTAGNPQTGQTKPPIPSATSATGPWVPGKGFLVVQDPLNGTVFRYAKSHQVVTGPGVVTNNGDGTFYFAPPIPNPSGYKPTEPLADGANYTPPDWETPARAIAALAAVGLSAPFDGPIQLAAGIVGGIDSYGIDKGWW
jgi:hypothetical protein